MGEIGKELIHSFEERKKEYKEYIEKIHDGKKFIYDLLVSELGNNGCAIKIIEDGAEFSADMALKFNLVLLMTLKEQKDPASFTMKAELAYLGNNEYTFYVDQFKSPVTFFTSGPHEVDNPKAAQAILRAFEGCFPQKIPMRPRLSAL